MAIVVVRAVCERVVRVERMRVCVCVCERERGLEEEGNREKEIDRVGEILHERERKRGIE